MKLSVHKCNFNICGQYFPRPCEVAVEIPQSENRVGISNTLDVKQCCFWSNSNKNAEGNMLKSQLKKIHIFFFFKIIYRLLLQHPEFCIRRRYVYRAAVLNSSDGYGVVFARGFCQLDKINDEFRFKWIEKIHVVWPFFVKIRAWRGIFKSNMMKTWKTSSCLCVLLLDQWKSKPNRHIDLWDKQNFYSFLCGSQLASQENIS